MDIQLEITLMENRLTTMENKLNDVESKLDSLDSKMSQVIDAIIGNKLTKSNGLADDIREIGKHTDKHEQIINRAKWLWIGVVSVSTVIGFLLKIVLEFFAK